MKIKLGAAAVVSCLAVSLIAQGNSTVLAQRGSTAAGVATVGHDTVQTVAQHRTYAGAANVTVASYNVLGSRHTGPRSRWASGPTRARWAAALIASHGIDAIGFQELQQDQLAVVQNYFGSRFDYWPGNALRRQDTQDSIGWRTDVWRTVSKKTILIPYFHGNLVPMPVVLLEHRGTGIKTYFANFHNPATTRRHRDSAKYRHRAMNIEVRLAASLRATGIPTVFLGDMNEREMYFCTMARVGGLKAARGGYLRSNGSCVPPRPMTIDWIFGSPGMRFSNHTEDRSALAQRTSDHAMVVSNDAISRSGFTRSYQMSDSAAVLAMTRAITTARR